MIPQNCQNIYQYPFPPNTNILAVVEKVKGSHIGPWKGAIDFVFPLGTPILTALDGTVVEVIDKHKKYGNSRKYAKYYNFIQIQHKNGEYTEYGHLKPNSSKVAVGDKVTTGQTLAYTGKSGWMTQPHLHFLVFRLLTKTKPYKFRGKNYYFTGLKATFSSL